MHGHFYGNFTGNLAHAQSVCTRPFSRGEGPGDEAITPLYLYKKMIIRITAEAKIRIPDRVSTKENRSSIMRDDQLKPLLLQAYRGAWNGTKHTLCVTFCYWVWLVFVHVACSVLYGTERKFGTYPVCHIPFRSVAGGHVLHVLHHR